MKQEDWPVADTEKEKKVRVMWYQILERKT